MEEIDYSEESKHNLFESVQRERLDIASCIIAGLAPDYETVKKALEKHDLSISKKDYEKICAKMGLKAALQKSQN
jgi:hypothetical protein